MSKTFHRKRRWDDDTEDQYNPNQNRRRVREEKRKMKEYNVYEETENEEIKNR